MSTIEAQSDKLVQTVPLNVNEATLLEQLRYYSFIRSTLVTVAVSQELDLKEFTLNT